jgi:DNA-binding transcriptional MerR regulator
MKKKQLYSIGDVARLLDVQQHRVQYAHRSSKVPSPPLVAGRRLYAWKDITKLARHFNVDLAGKEAKCSRP